MDLWFLIDSATDHGNEDEVFFIKLVQQ